MATRARALRSSSSRLVDGFSYLAGVLALILLAANFPLMVAIPSAETNTVRIVPQDTSLNLDKKNYSTQTTLLTYTWPDNKVSNAIVMKFDLSALPAGAIVEQATLHLALVESDSAAEPTYTVTAHKLLGKDLVMTKATGYTVDGVTAWTPNTCCHNGVPMAQADISPAYDTRAIDKALGDKAWTITAMVQEWLLNPATNFGLLLNSDASTLRDRYRFFASMEHPNTILRPFLEITYSAPDATPPSVSIAAPAAGTTASGTVTVTATATDNVAVAGVQLELDGAPLGAEVASAVHTVNWDTTTVSDGTHALTAVARDWAGNSTTSAVVSVIVSNGSLRLSPQDTSLNINTTNYSTQTPLMTYTWPDNKPANAIVMKFDLSAVPAGAMVQQATLHLALVESDTAADTTYTVTAHKVLGRNPVIATATGYTIDGTTTWTPSTCCHNGVPLAQADISPAYDTRAIDKALGDKAWTITAIVQEWLLDPATNFGLLLNSDTSKLRDRYRFFASMEHQATQLRPYLQISYSPGAPDGIAPVVALTAPGAGTTVSGTVSVTANASDNVSVVGVQFKLDAANLGPEDTSNSYFVSWDTTGVANGSYTLTAVARDAAGNVTTSPGIPVTVGNDTTPPVISAVAAGSITVSGATISWTTNEASDSQVEYGLTSAYGSVTPVNSSLVTAHGVTLNGLVGSTLYHFRVRSRDAADNLATSADGTFTTLDGTSPVVFITAPTGGATVSGTANVAATATDNVGVAGVQFKLDGASLGAEDTTAPYSVSWNTTTASNGSHTLTAVARDAAGNVTTSPGIPVTVGNDTTPPVISAVAAGSITVSGATISWTTDEASDSQVEYGLSTAYGSMTTLSGGLVTAHGVTLNGLVGSTLYHFRVHSRDAAGNLATSADVIFTTLDGTPPVVTLTAPGAGTTVSGTANVAATATDNVGVVGVQFKLDGASLGAEDTTSPFSVSWNTTTTSDGTHTLTAVARDLVGNSVISAAVSVIVANGSLRLSPQDTSLNINTTNYSTQTTLMTYTWPDNKVANAIVMKFDLSGVPAGAIVGDATLHLGLVESDTAAEPTYTITAHKLLGKNPVITTATGYTIDGTTAWTPNTCCDSGAPMAQADISPAYDTRAIDKALGDKAWTLTMLVQEWLLNPATNFGLLLNSDASKLRDRYRVFASMEHTDAQLRPVLHVTYLPDTPDVTAPVVAVTAPAAGATVLGTTSVTADATDNVGVVGVQFRLDGVSLGAEDTAAPYSVSWNTTTVGNGSHTVTAVARDARDNVTTSSGIAVTVANDTTPPSISAVASGSITVSGGTITWITNEASDSQVEYGLTLAYGNLTTVNSSLVTSHAVTLGSLVGNTLYHFRVRSRDAAGNLGTSADATFTTLDGTPPVVAISAPAAGTTVSGTASVAADATDNVGVVGVQFKLDGASLGAEDTTVPYSVGWNTTTASNAAHTLTAVGRDAAGNQTTSTAVIVSVSNPPPPPPTTWANEPSGFTVIEDTGWESGALGNWYRIFTSGDKPITVGDIANSPIGESKALQIDYAPGHVGGGGTELRYDIAPVNQRNEIYVGYYIQVSSLWQGHSSGINKMIYLHDGGGGFSAMWYEMFGSGSTPLDLYVVNQSGSGPAGFHENVNQVTFARDQWHKVEIYQKQGASNNGIVRVWVNGILAIDRSDVDTRSTPIDNVTISGIWGGVGDSKNQADYMRFDRIRISRP